VCRSELCGARSTTAGMQEQLPSKSVKYAGYLLTDLIKTSGIYGIFRAGQAL
jgi:hypothetical protein